MSWSFGALLKGALWNRENDAAGIAIGQNIISKDIEDALPDLKSDAETQAEIYYKFAINDNIALTPVLQYVSNPLGGVIPVPELQEFVTFDSSFTFGIRTQISF
jgi:carbohydrate-selective porin OprB